MKLFFIIVRKKIRCDTKEELVFVEFNFIVIPICLPVRSTFQKNIKHDEKYSVNLTHRDATTLRILCLKNNFFKVSFYRYGY